LRPFKTIVSGVPAAGFGGKLSSAELDFNGEAGSTLGGNFSAPFWPHEESRWAPAKVNKAIKITVGM